MTNATEWEVTEVYEDFWRDIIEPNGVVDLDQVKRELHDFKVVMEEVRKVYYTITGGRISKVNTAATAVLGVVEELRDDDIERLRGVIQELDGMMQESLEGGVLNMNRWFELVDEA